MVNITVIEGRITHDLELKTTQNGVSVCSFSIASRRNYKVGEEYPTDFFNVVAWRSKAEFVCKHFKKGDRVFIVGSFECRKYTDKNGNDRVAIELKANEVYFGDYPSRNASAPDEEAPHFSRNAGDFEPEFSDISSGDDDLPF